MKYYEKTYLTAFTGAIFISFAVAMLNDPVQGLAALNTYGEGWFEVVMAGIAFLIALRQM